MEANSEIEDLKQRIVHRFYAGEDVDKDAWEFAEASVVSDDFVEFSFFDVFENPDIEDAKEYLEDDDFESNERLLEFENDGELTDDEYEKAKERFFERRLQSDPSYRIHYDSICDSSGRSVVVAVEETPLLDWAEVTVYSSSDELTAIYSKLGRLSF